MTFWLAVIQYETDQDVAKWGILERATAIDYWPFCIQKMLQ